MNHQSDEETPNILDITFSTHQLSSERLGAVPEGVTKRLKAINKIEECDRFGVKKDRSGILNKTYQMIMLPKFYQNCAHYVLTPAQYKMLEILLMLLQFHKTVTIEKLATVFPQPIRFESRRRSIQKFLLLPQLSIPYLWFPLLKRWVKNSLKTREKRLIFAIDRTQWRSQNVFVISLIEQKRAIPVYWILLPKKGCSNLGEQKKLIRPLLQLFKGYQMLVLGDREFHSIKLANWLHSKSIDFVLRQKQGTYIRQENQSHQRLQSLELTPGISFFLTGIQATKQKGFAKFNLAGYYKRKYRGVVEPAGWFLLTNLDSLKDAIKAFERLPKRWIVERTFGWLNRFRRLSKDYEYIELSEAMIYGSLIRLIIKRMVS
ncbi:MAG: IS4 family transposase [Nostoc sp. ChiVER01]|nr:IS4 family transposase [Nostoc sp. ChiVER01]MDZ8222249.1 IS4 family transposase [Nostoc sp. ChiVER01]